MRSTFCIRLIVLLALGGLLPAVANAQSTATAQNTVTVHIPAVLRMQLTANRDKLSSSVEFTSDHGTLDPDQVTVQVFSNTTWSLTVVDAGGGTGPNLQVRGGAISGWTTVTTTGVKLVDHAGPTGGWTPYDFAFRPEGAAPIDDTFHHTLTFTLARP